MTAAEIERIQSLCDLGRYADAGTRLTALLGREPQLAPAWTLFAYVHLAQDRYADALVAADRALSLDPSAEWPMRLSGAALDGLGRRAEAMQRLRIAVELDPHGWTARSMLARLLSRRRRTRPEALALAEGAVSAAPNEPGPYLALAEVHRRRRRTADAETAVRHALRLEPNDPDVRHELARLRLGTGRSAAPDLAGAAAGFAEVLATDPQHRIGAYNLGLVLRMFVSRVSVLVFLDAAFLGRDLGDQGSAAARVVPVLVLAVPVALALRFVRRLTPTLRQELRRVLVGRRFIGPTALLGSAVVVMVAAALAPVGLRSGLALAAAGLALVGRLLLVAAHEAYQRTAPGRRPGHWADSALVIPGLIFFAFFTVLMTIGLVVNFSPTYVRTANGVEFVLAAVGSAAATGFLGWLVWRRRAWRAGN